VDRAKGNGYLVKVNREWKMENRKWKIVNSESKIVNRE
jgi:hypothetical protein